jgi:hypothetical protein
MDSSPSPQATGVSATQYAWFFGALPALSAFIPVLVTAAQSATVPEDRRILVILFLILKRVYMYSIALSIVDVAARRSVTSPPGLGMSLYACPQFPYTHAGSSHEKYAYSGMLS